MATREEYEAAASVPPSKRTSAQQALVTKGSNMQSVRNADHAASERQRRGH